MKNIKNIAKIGLLSLACGAFLLACNGNNDGSTSNLNPYSSGDGSAQYSSISIEYGRIDSIQNDNACRLILKAAIYDYNEDEEVGIIYTFEDDTFASIKDYLPVLPAECEGANGERWTVSFSDVNPSTGKAWTVWESKDVNKNREITITADKTLIQ